MDSFLLGHDIINAQAAPLCLPQLHPYKFPLACFRISSPLFWNNFVGELWGDLQNDVKNKVGLWSSPLGSTATACMGKSYVLLRLLVLHRVFFI